MARVLIGSYPLRNQPGQFRDLLLQAGFELLDATGDRPLTAADYEQYLPQVDAVIAGGEALTGAMIAHSPGLRVIARTGVGYDSVDLTAANARKIVVTITPGTNEASVAEHTFALLLALSRRIVTNDASIKAGGWDRRLVLPIRECTLGLVGLGRIGRAVATRARAFEMRVIACDPLASADFDRLHAIQRLSFEDVVAQSDFVSLHLPLTESTRGMIHRGTLSRMKPRAILINTARGGLVNEPDLYDSLTSGHLAGAGLDVLNREPPEPDNPLLRLPNVIVSPHVGGIDTLAMDKMATMCAQAIIDLKNGGWPEACVVNANLREGWCW